MRLKAIKFRNYRAFKDTTLPLQPLTLLIGANSTGKTSAISAIKTMAKARGDGNIENAGNVPIGIDGASDQFTELDAVWLDGQVTSFKADRGARFIDLGPDAHRSWLGTGRVFELDPFRIAGHVPLTKTLELEASGGGLPAVLTTLQDQWPERFEALNTDLRRWLPEFSRVLFDTPRQGERAIALRTSIGSHTVPTSKLSTGTLLSLTLLTLCHLPTPPAILGLEEPDRGLHPRLLRSLKDSLLRLTSPELFEDQREPVQVIVTTHSPYFVDLFRDELESIVVTKKDGLYSVFQPISELPHVNEIVGDTSLGEAWYSGILGGVPVAS